MKLYQFWIGAAVRLIKTAERPGQAAFNHLYEVRPELAEQIRGTDKDPFYLTEGKGKVWEDFEEFLKVNWYPSVNGQT